MGIQQRLHTKLVQKLILTPSLQQAIKLLPMSTLELSDLLNQEMVENPMLEEVPTEELQPAEAAAAQEKADPQQQVNKTDTWDDLDDGYRPKAPQEVKELPPSRTRSRRAVRCPITCSGSCRCRPTTRPRATSGRPSSGTSTTTGISWRRSRSWPPWDRGRSPRWSAP